MTDRFDLEQNIMSCWGVVEDIEAIYNTERLYNNQDDMMNALLGLKTLYQIKFEQLFAVFEHMIRQRKFISEPKFTDSNFDNHMGKQG